MHEEPMPLNPTCPACGEGRLICLTRSEAFEFDIGDRKVTVQAENVPVQQCDTCGDVFSGPDAARIRHDAVCAAAGFLTPADYKSIRDNLGWSQQYLADLTGFGVATVSRSERGRMLPNRSYDKVLRALRDCAPFREYLAALHTNPASAPPSAPLRQSEPRSKPGHFPLALGAYGEDGIRRETSRVREYGFFALTGRE